MKRMRDSGLSWKELMTVSPCCDYGVNGRPVVMDRVVVVEGFGRRDERRDFLGLV